MTPRTNYEKLAADYAKHRRVHPGVLEAIVSGGRVEPSSSVLEVGCGTGNYIVAIQESTGCIAVGIDPAEAMLFRARERASSVRWIAGRAEELPVEAGVLDVIFSVDVIHHVSDRDAYFGECFRALKPGGHLCTATDSESDIRRRRPLSSHFPETIERELERYPRIETLHAEMAHAGFQNVRDQTVELEYALSDIQPFRDRAFSSLHLIDEEALQRGISRMERELLDSSIAALSLYTLVWGSKCP